MSQQLTLLIPNVAGKNYTKVTSLPCGNLAPIRNAEPNRTPAFFAHCTVYLLALFVVSATLLASCSSSTSSINGPVSNKATLPDTLKQRMQEQAAIIGFYAAVETDSNYLDTTQLPAWSSTRVFNALTNLWQATDLPERDTVFYIYTIRETGANDFKNLLICNASQQSVYQSVLDKYHYKRDTNLTQIMAFDQGQLLNTIGVAKEINALIGFPCAEPNWFGGDGDHVEAHYEQGSILFTFSAGYGDCMGGCMLRRFWRFRVYDTGEVKFLGAYGDRPPTAEERKS